MRQEQPSSTAKNTLIAVRCSPQAGPAKQSTPCMRCGQFWCACPCFALALLHQNPSLRGAFQLAACPSHLIISQKHLFVFRDSLHGIRKLFNVYQRYGCCVTEDPHTGEGGRLNPAMSAPARVPFYALQSCQRCSARKCEWARCSAMHLRCIWHWSEVPDAPPGPNPKGST